MNIHVFKDGRFVLETNLESAMPAVVRGMFNATIAQLGEIEGGIIEIRTKDGELMEIVIGSYLGDEGDAAL